MAGTLVVYVLIAVLGLDYLAFLVSLPDSGPLIGKVREALAAEGLPYTPLLILRGVPLKVYAGLALSLGLSLGSVLLWTVFARIVRIGPTFAAATVIRLLTAWVALLGLLWLAFYAFHFVRISRT